MPVYNSIGKSYSKSRIPDGRIVDSLLDLLPLSQGSVIADIGAGTGGYSRTVADRGFLVYAVEPSSVMSLQAIPHSKVQWLSGYAENIPLADESVDGVICILAMHHFSNLEKAVREMNRITKTGSFVFLTFDPRVGEFSKNFWLADYFPVYREFDFRLFPPIHEVAELIKSSIGRNVEISNFLLPHDLTDMFAAAGWRRPEIYLDADVRANISALALADQNEVEKNVVRLKEDLESGRWDEKYGVIRELDVIDVGYRFLCAKGAMPTII
jgi:ubiquinone/menaquinone biosynthesis C-methylase UbiE